MFYVLVLLSGTPLMQRAHRRRQIPQDVVRDTVLDLDLCLKKEDYRKTHGHLGISPRILGWLLNHWRGNLYRLGRLQFMPGVFRGGLRAFRHRTQRTVLALSEPGLRYRADGQRDGAGRVEDPEGAWESVLRAEGDEIVGQPILPVGRACRETVRLSATEWKQVLAPGDPVLEIHIPAGPPMDYAACAVSIRRAIKFFPRHFPDRPFVAFVCSSWILDAQFEALLPPTSNLVTSIPFGRPVTRRWRPCSAACAAIRRRCRARRRCSARSRDIWSRAGISAAADVSFSRVISAGAAVSTGASACR